MRFTVVTLFPEIFDSVLATSVLGKARSAGLLSVDFVNPRDFATDKHNSVDDTPYGGGPGMVMKCDTLLAAIESASSNDPCHRVLLSPVGAALTQSKVQELATREHLLLVCGRYEGVDERVVELGIDESLSIGDYVLTGGELGAMVIIDSVARMIPGVLGHADSASDESFSDGLLEYPQYTRPAEFRDHAVPEILCSGHHKKIEEWRRKKSIERSARHRPDLLVRQEDLVRTLAARSYVILAHHPVLDRRGDVVTTSVTNLDIHDIARGCATYGLAGYLVVSPIRLQREKIDRIIGIWQNEISQPGSEDRGHALATIEVIDSVESALTLIQERHGTEPWVVATSAQAVEGLDSVNYQELVAERIAESSSPLAIVLGTGWGLDKHVFSLSNSALIPLEGGGDFNHLSVRSAAAVILDRLFGKGSPARGR
jgi:tRNA (guanine37-N1)-methyltransferase